MLDITQDIRSLSDFKRRTSELVEQMKASGRPIVLTVNGRAELVVQDAAAYQGLLDLVDRLEAIAGIREGLASLRRGEGDPAEEVFGEIRRRQGRRSERA